MVSTSSTPNGRIKNAEVQYIQRSTVVTRYLPTSLLHSTIYDAETHDDTNISRLPHTLDWVCTPLLLVRIIASVPIIPSARPTTFFVVKWSTPTTTDRRSTSRGVVVPIIEPSMGEVSASPNIIQSLRATPISSAAPNILALSWGATLSSFSHISGTSEKSAAIRSDAVTIAMGEIYFPRTRL